MCPAANELSAAKVDAEQLSEAIDGTLGKLESVCCELCTLAGQPQLWLLCAADQTGYKQMDDHINAQHTRSAHTYRQCMVQCGQQLAQSMYTSPCTSLINTAAACMDN